MKRTLEKNGRIFDLLTSVVFHDAGFPLAGVVFVMQISRRLERIADLITNIAEDVVYMTEAVIVRHHGGNHKA